MRRYRIVSSCLAKPSLIAICMEIIRTLQLRRKLRALTPELQPEALLMGTTTVAATQTQTWSEQMYPWVSQLVSRTLACFTYLIKVTRQIIWFSQLLAFPIMIDHTLSVSACDSYRLKNFPGKLIWVNFAEFWCFLYIRLPIELSPVNYSTHKVHLQWQNWLHYRWLALGARRPQHSA